MLDTETKRRIDTCRDILVGKVPDPKSQVEQITIALIYKFMDDMDAEAEELGGKRSFFVGKFRKYGWTKLMAPKMGGFDVLNVYSEAIQKMNENPGIPPLFRDIFKNAYLPYRDPETLRIFLKEINGFTYDHSERLGDAFEYLLSVLGSQGDAGQFRTPRHIIDFMVEIINPQKNETILDPACGTAGFLISSYKHILKNNSKTRPGDKLTPAERTRLAKNIHGYDISPDMVRLSLVNLYLHGFTNPRIEEYDTLTSEDKWNDYADVIMANPPFMSPKGGMKPHKRFSVQSKRSEVLFVDYMAEHLTPTGRAAIIVPEGIIFQSQKAHKQLRKMLVENYLVAVVSLPAGVFNPYAGVKTSILILDRKLAKKSDAIAFFKVENDGFGLGAQRREIDKNDLPAAVKFFKEWFQFLRTTGTIQTNANALIVEKAKISANGDYNLSGERYRVGETQDHHFPLVRIGEICTINPPKSLLNGLKPDTRLSFVPMSDLNENRIAFDPKCEKCLSEVTTSYTYFQDNDILVAKVTPCFENGKAGIAQNLLNGIGFGSSEFYVLRPSEQVLPEWIYFCVTHPLFRNAAIAQMTGTGGLQRIPKSYVVGFQIPLPPLEVQKEIVAEIEGYQKVIDGARAVLDNYRPHIPIRPDWPMVELGNVCETIMDGTHFSPPNTEKGDRLYITSKNVRKSYLDLANVSYISEEDHRVIYSRCAVKTGDVLYIKDGANTGLAAINTLTEEFSLLSSVAVMRGKPEMLDNRYLVFFLNTEQGRQSMLSMISGVAITRLTLTKLNAALIPLPPLETQKKIVAEIEAEQALVAANRELIERFEKKIQATLARVWGETTTIPDER
jgi:type I restriction enzyme M protein